MKLFYTFALILITNFSYAQLQFNSDKIYNNVKELNDGSIYEVYKYDKDNNALHYQMFFPDEESFSAFTHFKSVESIFEEAFRKLDSSGTLEQVVSLGVNDLKLIIRNEKNGDVFVSKLLSLAEIQSRIGLSQMNNN